MHSQCYLKQTNEQTNAKNPTRNTFYFCAHYRDEETEVWGGLKYFVQGPSARKWQSRYSEQRAAEGLTVLP